VIRPILWVPCYTINYAGTFINDGLAIEIKNVLSLMTNNLKQGTLYDFRIYAAARCAFYSMQRIGRILALILQSSDLTIVFLIK
jgi:hypothetical protein